MVVSHSQFLDILFGQLSIGRLAQSKQTNLEIPHGLVDLIYPAVPFKCAELKLGPMISYLSSIWHLAKRESKTTCK